MTLENLLQAIKIGNLHQIQTLINNEPFLLTEKDSRLNLTPLFHAVLLQNAQSVRTLINLGSDINQQTQSGQTPLHISSDNSSLQITKTLLQFYPNPNIPNFQGQSPLHNSTFRGDYKISSLLLEYGADPNFQSTFSRKTPLHIALEGRFSECVILLRSFGASINIKDKFGKTARELAKQLGMGESLLAVEEKNELLVKSGLITIPQARPSDEQGWTLGSPLTIFSPKGFPNFLQSFPSSLESPNSPIKCGCQQEPDAQMSLKNSLFPLKNFLTSLNLEEYMNVLVENSLDSLQQLVMVQKSADYLTIKQLKSMGINKVGHCAALLIGLDQEAGISESICIQFPLIYEKKKKYYGIKCCKVDETSFISENDIENWLARENLGSLAQKFVEAGYSLELIYKQYLSRHSFDEKVLLDIGIQQERHTRIILNKLRNECRSIRKQEIQVQAAQECVSCKCIIF